jgi:gamma-glutamylcyclotransferase (GGCT)/AIG2-like uncharacterized protein YtfP
MAALSLFSYGTLQQPEVQLANYGRLLAGTADALTGYRLAPLAITDPHVIAVSGKAIHTIACRSDNQADRIEGMVFELRENELAATDASEGDAYRRVEVMLESGRTAWTYVGAPSDAVI